MHIEFIELLRCPRTHEESWLVAALYRMEGRVVLEAKLGCPVCGAEYPIHDGVAFFDEVGIGDESALDSSTGDGTDPTRIAAFLDLTRRGELALLAGDCGGAAEALADLSGSRIIALNGPSTPTNSQTVGAIRAVPPIPLAEHSLDGIALDQAHSTSQMLSEATRLLRPRGRLVAAAGVSLPPQFRELARDANQVVAEHVGDLVTLRR
jgi:uncharacterized protein YbaR (Trm112 family)